VRCALYWRKSRPLAAAVASSLRIWALLGARPGDNDQVLALAEAAGVSVEIKRLEYNHLRRLGPRLLGCSLISLTRTSRKAVLDQPLPNVTISTGHRSVPVVRALRERSGGRLRTIHVGFPRVSPDNFDLVIATPQYPIDDCPSLLRIPYALTRAATLGRNSADLEKLLAFPRPHRLLIVGGTNIYWKIDELGLLQTLRQLVEEAHEEGGSVMITTSPRTSRILTHRIAGELALASVPTLLAEPGKSPDYATLLKTADTIRITADSVSMVSDAIWTGKPIALVPVTANALCRFAQRATVSFGRKRPLYPQDLRSFWRALEEIGVTRRLGVPRTSTSDVMVSVLSRVREIIPI
jgi:mitochondrial fission protein ELM1